MYLLFGLQTAMWKVSIDTLFPPITMRRFESPFCGCSTAMPKTRNRSVVARIAFPSWKKTTQIALSLKQLLFQSLENVDWSFRVWPWLSRKNDLCDLSHDHIVPWTSHRTDHLRPYNSLLDMGRAPVKSTRALLGQRHTVLLPPSNFLEIEQASEGWWFFERSCWRFPAVFLGKCGPYGPLPFHLEVNTSFVVEGIFYPLCWEKPALFKEAQWRCKFFVWSSTDQPRSCVMSRFSVLTF